MQSWHASDAAACSCCTTQAQPNGRYASTATSILSIFTRSSPWVPSFDPYGPFCSSSAPSLASQAAKSPGRALQCFFSSARGARHLDLASRALGEVRNAVGQLGGGLGCGRGVCGMALELLTQHGLPGSSPLEQLVQRSLLDGTQARLLGLLHSASIQGLLE